MHIHSLTLAVWDKQIAKEDIQIFLALFSFQLIFAMQRVKASSFFLLTLKGIIVLWRGDGLGFFEVLALLLLLKEINQFHIKPRLSY